jgi:hypothetical protein
MSGVMNAALAAAAVALTAPTLRTLHAPTRFHSPVCTINKPVVSDELVEQVLQKQQDDRKSFGGSFGETLQAIQALRPRRTKEPEPVEVPPSTTGSSWSPTGCHSPSSPATKATSSSCLRAGW